MSDPSDLLEEESTGDWITTYADLVTLLLVFFVLLFSVSTMDLKRFKEIAASFQKSFGKPTAVIELVAPDVDRAPEDFTSEPPKEDVPLEIIEEIKAQARAEAVEELREELREEVRAEVKEELLDELDQQLLDDVQKFIEKTQLSENIVVYSEKGRITIMVEGQIFFASGKAALNTGALPILDEIAVIINNYQDYRVNIKGHTDDRPISTVQFPSNWELSAVRATTVLRRLVGQGVDAQRLTATGYGELLPLAPNDSAENRARNRRVEFVLEKEGQKKFKTAD